MGRIPGGDDKTPCPESSLLGDRVCMSATLLAHKQLQTLLGSLFQPSIPEECRNRLFVSWKPSRAGSSRSPTGLHGHTAPVSPFCLPSASPSVPGGRAAAVRWSRISWLFSCVALAGSLLCSLD